MVVPRKWKLVAGAMSATVALGTSAAVAQAGDESTDEDSRPVLTEVVDIETLAPVDDTKTTLVQDQVLVEDESPFDSVAEESATVESESLPSGESASVESESLPSEESASVESESLPSEESASVDSTD